MTSDDLFTHALPRASDECKPHLLAQLPQLKNVDHSGVTTSNWQKWLAKQVAKYGERLAVRPVPKDAHKFKHPITEALEVVGGHKKVIVVQVGKK